MKNVAIIGSNGFIGSHLTKRLSKEKDLRLYLFGRSKNSSAVSDLPYETIDFSDHVRLANSFKNIDIVYYLASETIPATSWDSPLSEIEKNLVPFIKFLEIISKSQVKKIAFISSAGTVYGATAGKVAENFDKRPFSPYGIVKLAMENFLNYYKVKYNLQNDIYRISNVYGMGQDTSKGLGIINTFLENILDHNKVTVYGDGSTTRNYIYVGDVAELLTLSTRDTVGSGDYNISSDDTLSINTLIQTMRDVVEQNFEIDYKQGRQSDNSYIDLDNERILRLFPDFKFTRLNDGILKTYNELKLKKANLKHHG